MARKEDKLRPYRVDYFDIEEMKDNDLALVKSVIVRAVTATEAIYHNSIAQEGRIIIRSARFYKTLTHKKDIYKAVEDLFSANKAITIMEAVEAYRAKKAAPPVGTVINLSVTPQPVVMGAPESGPTSPATVAAVADLNGMLAHDAHEQTMDTFVPQLSSGVTTPQLQAAVGTKEPFIVRTGDGTLGMLDPSGTNAAQSTLPRVPHWAGCACAVCNKVEAYPLWAKITVFGGVLLLVVKLVMFLLHR